MPLKCGSKGLRAAQICFHDFLGEFAMLAWIAAQSAHVALLMA
jgi:hypothetical protein